MNIHYEPGGEREAAKPLMACVYNEMVQFLSRLDYVRDTCQMSQTNTFKKGPMGDIY